MGTDGLDVTDSLEYFSRDYFTARDRFREFAAAVDARLLSYPIDIDPSLTIDVAIVNASAASELMLVSSGVHGVEGPLGSAIQLATLDGIRKRTFRDDLGYVFVHAINPFGYVHRRRWNEDNIDLNRNFRCSTNTYRGCSDGYENFNKILNPPSRPSRLELFRLKALWMIARCGVQAIKEAVATGQYEYPKGLFFGGKGEACSSKIVREHYDEWVGDAREILHLDIHTGLGRSGEYKLLVEQPRESPVVRWFRNVFGDDLVEDTGDHQTSYDARGTFGLWTAGHMADRTVRFATLEVGTHPVIRVLGALRAENRAFHYANNDPQMEWTRTELLECFCPADTTWRRRVMRDQMDVIGRCVRRMKRKTSRPSPSSQKRHVAT